jgi:tellurite resistance-related uncharacterized protein
MRGWADSLIGPNAPPGARAEFIRSLQVIAVIGVLMVAGALWYLSLFGPLALHMVIATTLGVFVSVLLGCGLFAVGFFSAKSGYDQDVTDATHRSFAFNPTQLPDGLASYRRTAMFSEETVPAALLADHDTKPGTWGLIHVVEGRLRYRVTDPRRAPLDIVLTPATAPGVVEPTIRHHVEPLGPVRFQVEFWREAGEA